MSAPTDQSRARAAAVLGTPADAAAADARAAFFRRLTADGFAPAEEAVAAANTAAGTTLPLTPTAAADLAARLRDEVDAFAAAYWSLPPDERRVRWAALAAACRDEPTRRRVAALEPGLDVAVAPHFNPLVEETAAAIRELFVLGPRDRAVRGATWLADRAGRHADLADAARRLRADAPALADLGPELMRRLAEKAPLAVISGIDSQVAAAERNERAQRAMAEFQRRMAEQSLAPARPAQEWPDTWTMCKGGFILVSVLFGLLKALFTPVTSTYRPERSTPPPATWPETAPAFAPTSVRDRQDQQEEFRVPFTPSKVALFQNYERQITAGKGGRIKPLGYDLWRDMGRPGVQPPTGVRPDPAPGFPPPTTAPTRPR